MDMTGSEATLKRCVVRAVWGEECRGGTWRILGQGYFPSMVLHTLRIWFSQTLVSKGY